MVVVDVALLADTEELTASLSVTFTAGKVFASSEGEVGSAVLACDEIDGDKVYGDIGGDVEVG